ncbi:MAG TPA: DNA-3-methyladenine glycosylase 2 family protein [Gammaproteobacteria bacterium]|jgi:3-methyladenine DNA glycosylase/8-oxoguanine DNA glycosylase|nr:DNA-3-methyladenine glycosylase 2 family protein [Gammaproteobacteria bacterium]
MAAVIAGIGPCRLEFMPLRSPFHSLMRAITYQQLSGKAAATILGRVVALFPPELGPHPEALLALPEASLRGAGLSRNKLLALKDLAAKALDGTVPDSKGLKRMPDAEIIERLTQVRGVGRWTVEMLLIFTLGRPDVLPVTDLGVRKGFQRAYGMKRLPAYSTLERAGRAWAPYRSIASWYLWRVTDGDAEL